LAAAAPLRAIAAASAANPKLLDHRFIAASIPC
jgi:hypothetical protein